MTSSSNRITVCLWILACCVIATYLSGPIRDPDIWWHIVVGRWIISHKSIPYHDHWTYFGDGKLWIAYSWIPEIIFSLIDRNFLVHGLAYSQLILLFLLGLSMAYTLGKISGDFFVGLLLSIIVSASMAEHYSLRPQAIGWLIFIWTCYLTHQSNRLVILLMALWANIHLSFSIGIIWLLFNKNRFSLPIILLSILSSFMTPYGLDLWKTVVETSYHPIIFKEIREFASASIWNNSIAIFILLGTLLIVTVKKNIVLKQTSLFAFQILITVISIFSIKFLPFASISLAFLIAIAWTTNPDDTPFAIGIQKLNLLSRKLAIPLGILFIICITQNVLNIIKMPLDKSQLPEEAMNVLLDKPLSGSIINTFGDGGYITYRLADANGELPSLKVSIDGRTNLISKEVWKSYRAFILGDPGWKEWVTQVNPSVMILPSKAPVIKLLNNWCGSEHGQFTTLLHCG